MIGTIEGKIANAARNSWSKRYAHQPSTGAEQDRLNHFSGQGNTSATVGTQIPHGVALFLQRRTLIGVQSYFVPPPIGAVFIFHNVMFIQGAPVSQKFL